MHDPVIEDRVTAPDDPGRTSSGSGPGDWFVADIIAQKQAAGEVWVDHHSALTYSSVWACVRYIAQTVASLGWHLYERQGDGRSKVPVENDVSWLLSMQASPEMDAYNWRQVMLKDALTWGNGYSEIERDRAGRPLWLWRLAPDRVCPERDDLGNLWYSVRNQQGGHAYLPASDVFHLKGLSPDGLVGYSVVSMARRSIHLGMSTENYGANFFSRGPMPGGVLRIQGNPKDSVVSNTRESFQRLYGGSVNAGRIAVLYGGMEFSPFTLPNDDAQFLESRSFQVEEVCRWFGVPQHKVAKLDKSTNNNIEHQAIEAVQDCLLPWCRRLECEADVKMFGRTNRGRRFTRLNLSTLLRGDSQSQTETVTKRVAGGLMTINEGREYIDLNPHPQGDELLIQGAMAPLDRILNPPEPEPSAPPPEPEPPEPEPEPEEEETDAEGGDMPEDLAAPFRVLLSRAFASLLRVEADKARRAANKGQLDAHLLTFYSPSNVRHIEEAITPILDGFCLATGKRAALTMERVYEIALGFHEASWQSLAGDGVAALDGWEGRAHTAAVDALDRIWGTKDGR